MRRSPAKIFIRLLLKELAQNVLWKKICFEKRLKAFCKRPVYFNFKNINLKSQLNHQHVKKHFITLQLKKPD